MFDYWTTYHLACQSLSHVQLFDPMVCSLTGSSIHGILQATILEWVAIFFSRGSFWLRNQIHISCISCIGRWILYHCTTRKASTTLGSPTFFQNTQTHRFYCKSHITSLLCTKPEWSSWERPHHCYLSCLSSLPPYRPICCLNNLWHTQTICGEGNGNPLQYSCLENPTDGGAWWATVQGVTKSQTWLSDFTFTFTLPLQQITTNTVA